MLNNNSGFTPAEIDHFNYELLSDDFENPLLVRKLDVEKYSIFGFLFAETSPDNEEELNRHPGLRSEKVYHFQVKYDSQFVG